jgi:cyclohexanone monooxygenase
VDAVVVGAGFSGLYMLVRLRELGLSSVVIEAGEDVGGTWYWNRYPGARCDVESLSYSYSFSPELEQDWEWTERYPAQAEILRYARHVAQRFGLRRDIRFGTRVTGARWEGASRTWHVRTAPAQGDGTPAGSITARFLVMATGCLSAAKLPEIPGIGDFRGAAYHTARWPHDGVDFTGLRVGLIGTGSSAVQSIPVIAEQAAELTVFQRTPAYSLPARNRALHPGEQEDMKSRYREWRQAQRESAFGIPRTAPTQSALEVPPAERTATFEKAWNAGGLTNMSASYTDISTSLAANDTARMFIHDKIRSIVADPVTAADLCPQYPMGTKRPCLDTRYYETFNRPSVYLVNLRREPLECVRESGLRTSARSYEFDALVFATGFDAMTGALTSVDIRGCHGASLAREWRAGPRTYLGVASAGFPNLFMITGPGSPSVLSNMMVSIEQHVEWVAGAIAHVMAGGLSAIEATREAQDAWVEHVGELAARTLFPRANSWYMGANVAGKPRVFMPYVGGVGAYRARCDQVARDGYPGFSLTA